MKIFEPGDLVRLASTELEMLVICDELESAPGDKGSSRFRCAWDEGGMIVTSNFHPSDLVLIRCERRRLPRFDLRFPTRKGKKNAVQFDAE